MINLIPIKCFTCGTLIADKYEYYLEEVRRRKLQKNNISEKEVNINKVIYLTNEFSQKTIEGDVLDIIGLTKMCCRKHLISHVN